MAGNPTLPTENISEVILRLLALEPNEIAELDYETYRSYLKELLVEIGAGRKIDSGEAAQVSSEFKRIKGKKGRFKIGLKKSKITADKFGIGRIGKQLEETQKKLMLAPTGGVSAAKKSTIGNLSADKSETGALFNISKTIDSILSTLISIDKENKKRREQERKDAESKRRTGREKELESKTFEGIKKAISVITKPFQSIWDKIVNFITSIILGRIVLKLIDWFADPKNQDKIQSIIRFVKDWWPALLGSYILFGTSFGSLIRFTLGWVGKFAFQLARVAIPRLLSIIAANPLTSLAVGGALAAGVGAYAASQQNKKRRDEFAKSDKTIVTPEQTAKTGRGPGGVQLQQEQVLQRGLGGMFSGGGFAGGLNLFNGLVKGPKGKDKVPAMLTDGEFVMSTGAVQKYGLDTLESMNAAGGGTNIPQISNGFTYAAGGGMVGSKENAPKISPIDYNTLLAISSLEADNPQGRADVAQSLYNRLYAANKYGVNFNQSANSLKNLITAPSQYEPTFTNRQDWLNIVDRKTAAIAIMNSKKGKTWKWKLNDAIKQLSDTDKALKNSVLQQNAQKHVGGRAFFLGTSQHGNIKPGDKVRDSNSNFFSPWYLEGTPYDKERRNIAAPVPSMLDVQQKSSQKPQQKQNPLQAFFNIFTPRASVAKPSKSKENTPKYADGGFAPPVPPVRLSKPSRNPNIKPPVRSSKPAISYLSMGSGGQLSGMNPPTSSSKPPSQPSTHFRGTRLAQATLGVII